MFKRTTMLVAVLTIAGLAVGLAQKEPNFSGTWALDKEKSDAPMMGRGGPGGGRGGGGAPMGDVTLVITQTDTELTIERKMGDRTDKLVYKLDGTESTNPGPRGEMKSKTRWDGDKLVTEGSQTMSTPRGEMTLSTKEVRRLSADGTVMTVEATTETPRGENTRKTVFTKKTS